MDHIFKIHITGKSSHFHKSFAKGRLTHYMDYMFNYFTFNNELISESFLIFNLAKYKI